MSASRVLVSPVRQLRDDLHIRFVRNSKKLEFIPENVFDQLMSKETVSKVFTEIIFSNMNTFSITRLANEERVFAEYRKILAILVFIGKEHLIMNFLDHGRSDERLPFCQEELASIHLELPISLFPTKQYCFLAVKFNRGFERLLGKEWILPFIYEKPVTDGEGGFGRIYEVEIHESHYDPSMWMFLDGEKHVFARKELKPNKTDEQNFTAENGALKNLQFRCEHPNLVPLLACYKYGTKYNFIFPRADCDLHMYFRQTERPQTTEETFLLFERISKLAAALNKIHDCDIFLETDGQTTDFSQIGLHRDLKPKNILKKGDIFMIADFGLARFKDHKLSSNTVWEWGFTTYSAPECQKKAFVNRLSDIWSLGCIFSEVVTFAVLGQQGIEEYSEKRLQYLRPDITIDLFYDLSTQKVMKEVLEWFDHLRAESGNNPFIVDILKLVEEMLCPADTRPRTKVVVTKFSEILKQERARSNIVDIPQIEKRPGSTARVDRRKTLPDRPVGTPMMESVSEKRPVTAPSTGMGRHRSYDPRQKNTPGGEKGIRGDPRLQVPLWTAVPRYIANSQKGKSPFGYLKMFDTVFLIDDSESMVPLWNSVAIALQRFLPLAIWYNSDGVDLHFMGSQERVKNATSCEDVFSTFRRIKPGACTSITLSLDGILSEYVWKFKANQRTKPLNLIVITDGDMVALENPSDPIIRTAIELDAIKAPICQAGVQFALIGSSKEAQIIFQDMDDNLWSDNRTRDIVDTTVYDPDMKCENDDILLKIMCGAVNRLLDAVEDGSAPGSSSLGV